MSAGYQAQPPERPIHNRFPGEERRQSPSNSVALWVIAAIVGVFALCGGFAMVIVVCLTAISVLGTNANKTFSNVAMVITSANSSPKEVATKFLDDFVSTGGRDPSIVMSRERQGDMPRVALALQGIDVPTDTKSHWKLTLKSAEEEKQVFTATVTAKDGSAFNAEITLIDENGQWKVDEWKVTMGDKAP
jgi:hypothetical protein